MFTQTKIDQREQNYLAWQRERGLYPLLRQKQKNKTIFFIGMVESEGLPEGQTMLSNIIKALGFEAELTGYALFEKDFSATELHAAVEQNPAQWIILLGENLSQAFQTSAPTSRMNWEDYVCQPQKIDSHKILPIWSTEDMSKNQKLKAQTWLALKEILAELKRA